MHIAIITAGGAGMFCGSCMHDNTWARALIAQGAEVSLIPTYTPIRVDEQNASLQQVFLGGINVYLNGKFPWWQRLPRTLTGWLDRPGVIRFASRWSVSNDAAQLGELTLSMLQGEHGPHRQAVTELARYLGRQLKPDVIIFSNALLVGALHEVRQFCPVPVLCTLQGDDVFLDGLPAACRDRAIELISEKAQDFDHFLTHTEFYRDSMARYLSLPREKFSVLPLGIEVHEHAGRPKPGKPDQFTIGYFARMAPEKGLHHLAEACSLLHQQLPHARLRIGGYQDAPYRDYFQQTWNMLLQTGMDVENVGSPNTVEEKVAFLSGLDVLSVPTDFLEPKGMYVLEAMANGVPVVQPGHGAFPEILSITRGGILVTPRDPQALAAGLMQMADPEARFQFAQNAWRGVREHYDTVRMARRTLEILASFGAGRDHHRSGS